MMQTAVIQSNVIDESGAVVHDYLRTETAYDELGRRVLVRENISQGNPLEAASIDDSAARDTHYEYNSAGNLEAVILPAADDPDEVNPAILTHPRYEYTYDIYGNLKSIKDNIKQDDPLVSTTDATGARETLFTYDEEHRQLTRTLPDGLAEQNFYDNVGRLDRTIDFEGRVTRFSYDTFGRLEQERFYSNIGVSESMPEQTRDYTVDALGRTTQIDDTLGGIWKNVYDARGRLTQEVSPQGIVNYGYNGLDQLTRTFTSDTELATNAITDTEYAYDVLGRLKTVTAVERNDDNVPISEVTTYTYDTLGNLDTVTLPNGAVSDYVYDELNRLIELEHTQSGGQVISRYEYDLALDGKRIRSDEYDDVGLVAAFDWVYDDLGRLTREIYDGPGTADDFKALYYFDLVGNRLRKSGDADQTPGFEEDTRYTYDDNDRLLTEIFKVDSVLQKTTTYEYGAGDRTELTRKLVVDEINPATLEDIAYQYNLQGRLSHVDRTQGASTTAIDYKYNPSGIRVEKSVSIDGGPVEVTKFVIDDNNHTGHAQVLEERDAGDAILRSYTFGHDLIAQGEADNSAAVLVTDGHGSTRHLIDVTDATNILESYTYDAYGNAVGFSHAQTQTNFKYSGEQHDADLGQDYLRARYYDAFAGRFIRSDTYPGLRSDPRTLHKYLYTHADPVNGSDPLGLFTVASSLGASSIGSGLNNLSTTFSDAAFDAADRETSNFATVQFNAFLLGLPIAGVVIGRVAGLLGDAVRGLCQGVRHVDDAVHRLAKLEEAGDIAKHSPTKFSHGKFRGNVGKLHGIPKEDLVDYDIHHVFPVKFQDRFEQIGIDIDNPLFGSAWKMGEHRGISRQFNQQWEDFLRSGPRAEEAMDFGRELMQEYGFRVFF